MTEAVSRTKQAKHRTYSIKKRPKPAWPSRELSASRPERLARNGDDGAARDDQHENGHDDERDHQHKTTSTITTSTTTTITTIRTTTTNDETLLQPEARANEYENQDGAAEHHQVARRLSCARSSQQLSLEATQTVL